MTCSILPLLIFRYEYRSQVLYYEPTLVISVSCIPWLRYNGHRNNASKARRVSDAQEMDSGT